MSGDQLQLARTSVTAKLIPKEEKSASLVERVKKLGAARKAYLVVGDLRTNTQPGVTYSVYLNLPSEARPEVAAKHHVGTINFFNATIDPDKSSKTKPDRFQSFDVTSLLKALAVTDNLGDEITVAIVPDGVPVPEAKPRIGCLTLIER